MARTSEQWLLKRADDNGQTYVMQAFTSKEEAEAQALFYERKGHKQLYWVEAG